MIEEIRKLLVTLIIEVLLIVTPDGEFKIKLAQFIRDNLMSL